MTCNRGLLGTGSGTVDADVLGEGVPVLGDQPARTRVTRTGLVVGLGVRIGLGLLGRQPVIQAVARAQARRVTLRGE